MAASGGDFSASGVDFNSIVGAKITTGGGAINLLGQSGAVTIRDTLDASGGALPLTWLVNGRRVDSAPFRREAEWLPEWLGGAAPDWLS